MKKRKLFAVLAAVALAVSAVGPMTAQADGRKVVTLGADLSEDQKVAVLKYFGVYGQNIETLYITNQDERNHLGSYIPLEQIGSRTFSCALVCPTTSGGIHVKTANLSFVTSNMIASTLSTSGVVNCDVLAASPFEVSGTGALTGIMMAYETASGTKLDEEKKEIATQELVTTGQIAESVGQTQATEIVNEIKIQIIQGQVVDEDEVNEIVYSVVEDVAEEDPYYSSLSEEDYALLNDLANQIAQQQYDYEEMKETLERVEQNVESISETVDEIQDTLTGSDDEEETPQPETLAEDSILMQTDDTALGENVIIDATNEEALSDENVSYDEQTQDGEEDAFGFDITTSDDYDTDEEPSFDDGEDMPDDTVEATYDEGTQIGLETPDEMTSDVALTLGETALTQEDIVFGEDLAGTRVLAYEIANANLEVTEGTLTVTDAFQNIVTNVSLTDPDQTAVRPVPANTLQKLNWSEGTQILVLLDEALSENMDYTVSISGTVSDGAASAPILEEFHLSSGSTGVAFQAWTIGEFAAGKSVTGSVLFGEAGAVYAEITNYDPQMISFDQLSFDTENTSLTAMFLQAGDTSVTVSFTDADGNYAGETELYLSILE